MDIKALFEKSLEYPDIPKEEEEAMIHDLTQSKGWGIIRRMREDRIRALLTPFDFAEGTSMSVRGAIYEARHALAKVLSEELSAVDTIERSYELRLSKKEEKSEKGDEDI